MLCACLLDNLQELEKKTLRGNWIFSCIYCWLYYKRMKKGMNTNTDKSSSQSHTARHMVSIYLDKSLYRRRLCIWMGILSYILFLTFSEDACRASLINILMYIPLRNRWREKKGHAKIFPNTILHVEKLL